jgi:L-asparagine oxygenase
MENTNNNNDSVLELDNYEIETLLNFANLLNNISPSDDADFFCSMSKKLSLCLHDRVISKLMNFARYGSETGFLLIKNIPIDMDNLPNTPPGNNYKIGEKTTLAKIQSMILNVFSELIAYEAEGYGRLFQDVVPNQSMAKDQTSLGSNTELEIHTEQAFSKLRPDVLSLACLRGDKQALTYILPVKYIIDNMSEEENELLRKPLWKTGVDLSFKLNGHEFLEGDVRGPLPIINGDLSDPQLIFDQDLMTGITEESESMIQKIVDIYYKHRISHNLCPGEIILIDNRRAVHGRSPFFPNFDGKDRFLIRCFSVLDYTKSNHDRIYSGRVVAATSS